MSNQQPIGIFDSGLGGLTVFEEIQALLPHESLVYVADSVYAPYGNKDSDIVIARSQQIATYLIEQHHIKALVVACNTATAAAIQRLREQLDIPVIGMEPAIKPAVDMTDSGVVGVLATENTLKSDKFSNLFDAHQHRARMMIQPCFGLVEAIEQGELDSASTKQLLSEYVQPMLDEGADTLVLGCTHYPLIEPLLRELVGEQVHIISTGAAVAKRVAAQLDDAPQGGQGKIQFFTSGDAKQVSYLASQLFGQDMHFQSMVNHDETVIIEFELDAKQHLLFQALLQGEDGLAFVRCVNGVQQLWTTASQKLELDAWLKSLPEHFDIRIVREYVWVGEESI